MAYSFNQLLNRLSFRQLQVFLTVYEQKGYSRAAEALGLTQPAVSAQIKLLEEALEQPLFDYVAKTLHVTPAGEELARCIHLMFGELRDLQNHLSELKGVISGSLNLAAVSTAQYVVPHLLAGFLRDHPRIEVTLKVVNRAQAINRLAANADDLVIMGMVPEDRSLSFMPFLDNQLIPVVNASHPLANRKRVSVAEFFAQPLLFREMGSGTRHALEAFCAEKRYALNWVMELGSNAAVKHGVLAGLGVAVMPMLSVQLELQQGLLASPQVDGFPLHRSWCTVYPSRKHLTPAAEAFLDYIRHNMEAIQQHFTNIYSGENPLLLNPSAVNTIAS